MALKTTLFDPAEYLKDDAAIAVYLEDAMETNDPKVIARAIGDVARARGMTDIAKASGLSRESLYKALSGDGNPEFATMLRVLKALGLRLNVEPVATTELPA
jgi:probable addiction module antidote protein